MLAGLDAEGDVVENGFVAAHYGDVAKVEERGAGDSGLGAGDAVSHFQGIATHSSRVYFKHVETHFDF